ncbi:MAG: TetR/AcrR family transcriptional regulator [Mariniphaga sp.]|jgi:hypothetical protein|nr:TetR/AcrR family transcriptional regulator [Mariniphaga sp.]
MNQETENPKYNDIVKTAHELFWKHGISRVTIEEICREANVSKMTFYKFFSNKLDLGKKVIDDIMGETIQKYRDIMNEDTSFQQKVKKQLKAKFDGTREISPELVNDIYSNKKLGLHKYWQKRANEITMEVMQDYKKAQDEGWIRKDLKIEFIFYFANKMSEFLSDSKLLAMYDSMQDLIMEVANLFFYGIFPHENENNN